MTIIHIPDLPVIYNFPDKDFTFDQPWPISGGCKKVYLGYLHNGKSAAPIPVALARPKYYPWQLNKHMREEANRIWENEYHQIERINSLFPHSKFFIQCLYVQRFKKEIIGFVFEKGICDLADLKDEHELCNPVTLQVYSRKDLIQFAHSMTTAVALLHENKVLHRDIKLENFILTRTGDVKLTDFGFVTETSQPDARKFHSTLAYSSPEELIQILHKSNTMPETYNMEWKDLWSLGLSCVHLFESSENCPEWLYEIEEHSLLSIPPIALRIRDMIREFLSRPQSSNYWGLLMFDAEDRSSASAALKHIENEL